MVDKVKKVMGEYKRGTLKSSSGKKVTSRDQAIAIAMSERRRMKAGGTVFNVKSIPTENERIRAKFDI
jgi:hypothetical protein|tara:strand:- start:62 stop:265 length:204 start_codon:yes stop_codon:yes gene_type:complete